MIYRVKASLIESKLPEFFAALSDGSIERQEPDGREIVASMKRAVLTAPGVAEWYETCYCDTPLHHERTTQYDRYFTDMQTEEAEDYGEIEGASLWKHMQARTPGA